MIHRCAECDSNYECGYGNPCSSHGEQIWCSDKCKEAWFGAIFDLNMKAGIKNEEKYL
jgi:hypothetical protein